MKKQRAANHSDGNSIGTRSALALACGDHKSALVDQAARNGCELNQQVLTMLAVDEHNMPLMGTPLEIVWRNPLNLVQAQLRAREEVHPYYRWAEHARKIRARRAKWNVTYRRAA